MCTHRTPFKPFQTFQTRLQVVEVVDGCDVVCVAKNEALLDGLLTVFHVERSSDELLNLQNDLPLLSDYDKECLVSLAVVRAGSSRGLTRCHVICVLFYLFV
jgi:hypothetical protein